MIEEHYCSQEESLPPYFDVNCTQRLLSGGYFRFNWNFAEINRDWHTSPSRLNLKDRMSTAFHRLRVLSSDDLNDQSQLQLDINGKIIQE